MVKIIADENIPYVGKVFSQLGEVHCVSGRAITAAVVADANVLLVRSITRVNEKLLKDSPVRFVGTATIGTDHIDRDYLESREITFTSAAGSNADSVVEYVLTALLAISEKQGQSLNGKTLGIVGVGNIGSRLEKKAAALGLRVLPNDPPVQRLTGDQRFVSLDKALAADIVTCHVPLTKTGTDATWHLLDDEKLSLFKPHQILINSSRGAIVDNQALKTCLQNNSIGPVVLDVWENEPAIDIDLLGQVTIATPHIAGYSLDGKVNGTVMLYQALCRFLNQPASLQTGDLLEPPDEHCFKLDGANGSEQSRLQQTLNRIYPILRDDTDLRRLSQQPTDQQGLYFDALRKNYPIRREAPNYTLRPINATPSLIEKLHHLGFQIAND